MGARGDPFTPKHEDLPEIVPVFPLSEALLLPGGRLPLNIFEPRYLDMVLDALGTGRMIGMVRPLPRREHEGGGNDPSALYATGCAGRISSFSETEDGRLLITLTGVSRFRIVGEADSARGYRKAIVDFSLFHADLTAEQRVDVDRPRLLAALRPYLSHHGINMNWRALEQLSDPALVTSISMLCPFDSREKQALLEISTITERANLLIALIEMGVLEAGGGRGRKIRQ
ncbi:MAG: LON peptidase substrate-binding domain-containing protein [Alphaproteobacteria bacterium]|nr:LON peptidase substrate-binding domain-containing protein [Alphaproteobacteria bacterium]MBF0130722.1 LON peptidase substrate-binding domain-containing protein [Alphaproteobacteria bacterium]